MSSKRTKKEEKEFQAQLETDRRNSAIHQRYKLVRDAIFLINQADHKLTESVKYYDCSKNPDFDDLHHNVSYARSFIEFAYEQLEEIMDRDYELGCTPEQLGAKIKKETQDGRRTGNGSREN